MTYQSGDRVKVLTDPTDPTQYDTGTVVGPDHGSMDAQGRFGVLVRSDADAVIASACQAQLSPLTT